MLISIVIITESSICSANNCCDNNGEVMCSTYSYCYNTGVYMQF